MATIQVPVDVLDERCSTCQCMSLKKEMLFFGLGAYETHFSCENLHMCQYIKNRIVRGEVKEENKND